MEPELLRNNQLRCDTIHRDIKMQANTVENLITRNDVNVKCPGDLMYNTCHKIPYSFGNNKKHLLYKYKSLQIENNNGLKNNYKLTCKEVIHNNITMLNYAKTHAFSSNNNKFKCFTGCKCPLNKPVEYHQPNGGGGSATIRCVTIRECKGIRLQHVLDKVESDISKSTIDSMNKITNSTLNALNGDENISDEDKALLNRNIYSKSSTGPSSDFESAATGNSATGSITMMDTTGSATGGMNTGASGATGSSTSTGATGSKSTGSASGATGSKSTGSASGATGGKSTGSASGATGSKSTGATGVF
jgi:hypothetical protein